MRWLLGREGMIVSYADAELMIGQRRLQLLAPAYHGAINIRPRIIG